MRVRSEVEVENGEGSLGRPESRTVGVVEVMMVDLGEQWHFLDRILHMQLVEGLCRAEVPSDVFPGRSLDS